MKKSVMDIDLTEKSVFLRADFNVPIKEGKILDTFRIDQSLPTIEYILTKKIKKLVIGSHLGRPKGKFDEKMSLKPVIEYLRQKLGNVQFVNVYEQLGEGLYLFENLRFHVEEEKVVDVEKWQKYFTSTFDVLVIDSFGVVHRDAGSLTRTGIKQIVAGQLLLKELQVLNEFEHTVADLVVIGGLKVSDKILLLKNLIPKTKNMFICGAMAYTFLKNNKHEGIGKSYYEAGCEHLTTEIIEEAKKHDTKLIFPVDHLVKTGEEYEISTKISEEGMGVDIGPKSLKNMQFIKDAKFIFWNGPCGIFEKEESSKGTKGLIEMMSQCSGKIIIGGGDTANAVRQFMPGNTFYHVSTGGGSLLESLEGKKLPGVEIIQDK